MNLIFIVTDTLRADHCGCYGNSWIKTPNIDRLARMSVQFNEAHGEGLPTIQARRVFMTGAEQLPFDDVPAIKGLEPWLRGWYPLKETDVTLADFLREKGYYNGMVSDLWHFFKPRMNYHRNFDTYDFIRGQERDPWQLRPKGTHDIRDHVPERLFLKNKPGFTQERLENYLNNTDWITGEEDFFCARTMRSAVRWLENCRDRAPFFLYVDTFDPHEVFDVPAQYLKLYHQDYPCERPLYGYGCNHHTVTPEDIAWIHGLYSAKVTLLDTWVGFLIDGIERLGLMEDTVVCFTSDHGTEFGEHGKINKSDNQIYRTVTQIPLLIKAPGADAYAGKKIDALVSAVDIAGTLLRLIGQTPPPQCTSRDLWKLATGEAAELRDHLIIGYGESGAVREHDWLMHTPAEPNARYKTGQIQATPALFDLRNDPGETVNVMDQHPEQRRRLLDLARRVWPDAM